MIQDQCEQYKSLNSDLNYQIFQLINEQAKMPSMTKMKSYIKHLHYATKQVCYHYIL